MSSKSDDDDEVLEDAAPPVPPPAGLEYVPVAPPTPRAQATASAAGIDGGDKRNHPLQGASRVAGIEHIDDGEQPNHPSGLDVDASPDGKALSDSVTRTRTGIEQIEDDNIGDAQPGISVALHNDSKENEKLLNRSLPRKATGIEQIEDGHSSDMQPGIPLDSQRGSGEIKTASSTGRPPNSKLEIVDGDERPNDPYTHGSDSNIDEFMKEKQMGGGNMIGPPRDNMEVENSAASIASTGNGDVQVNIENQQEARPQATIADNVDVDIGEGGSIPHIPEAFLVEEDGSDDGEVFLAEHVEPTLPWWKQRRTWLLFGTVIALVVALAIALGVDLSPGDESVATLLMTEPPTASNSPTVHLTLSPSVSNMPTSIPTFQPSHSPSSTPSSCVSKVISNVQKLDLVIERSHYTRVAINGKNMVAAVRDGGHGTGTSVFIFFYALSDAGEWQRVNSFQVDRPGNSHSVSIFGKTALVGFEGIGAVYVYEQNEFSEWVKAEGDPFAPDANRTGYGFGSRVHFDGEFAYINHKSCCIYIYQREGDEWVEIEKIDWHSTFYEVHRDTIALSQFDLEGVHLYRAASDGIHPLQDSIEVDAWPIVLSSAYLVFWDPDKDAMSVYKWGRGDEKFKFRQNLDIVGPWKDGLGAFEQLAMDNDILVSPGVNGTHIFSNQDGNWEEIMKLDREYSSYHLSGRTLIARDRNDIYSFDFEDCIQEMPTQRPSESLAPSNCYWIEVTSFHNTSSLWKTSWQLVKVTDGADDELVFADTGAFLWGGTPRSNSLCVDAGEYKFIVDNSQPSYGGSYQPGFYNVSSDGQVIAEGKSWSERSETILFMIPFRHYPSMAPSFIPSILPSMTILPSITQMPSLLPSSSLSPTVLHCITITVANYPYGPSVRLHQVLDGDNDNILLQSFYVPSNSLVTETFCLGEGKYEFTVYETHAMGLLLGFGDGNYNVTSGNGDLIAEGDDFGVRESTSFSLPYYPAS